MVTRETSTTHSFTVNIERLHDGTALVIIRRSDGQSRSYRFAEKKVRVFLAIDGPVKDAVEFLLGES